MAPAGATNADQGLESEPRSASQQMGTNMAKHALLERPPTTTTAVPDNVLAFTIGTHDDPAQLRAFWVREHDASYLDIEGPGLPPGIALHIDPAKIPELAVLLRESNGFAEHLAVPQ